MIRRIAAALLALGFAASALAQAAWTEGTVRKVDASTGRITLKHGDIKNLDMPAMTMVFTTRDKALLAGLNTGDKVEFTAAQDPGGELIVTAIQRKK